MQPFSLTCTTCKAKLKVRDAQLVGQILPCPKCGSMVLIEANSANSISEAGQADGPVPRGAPSTIPNNSGIQNRSIGQPSNESEGAVTSRDGAWSDSFDHIDDLLEEPAPRRPSSDDQRWRQEDLHTANGPRKAAVQRVETAPVDVREVGEPTTAETDSELADWLGAKTSLVRAYAMIGGGVALGVAMAVGVVGWIVAGGTSPEVLRETSRPTIVADATSDDAMSDDATSDDAMSDNAMSDNAIDPSDATTAANLETEDRLVDAEFVEAANLDSSEEDRFDAQDRLAPSDDAVAVLDETIADGLEEQSETNDGLASDVGDGRPDLDDNSKGDALPPENGLAADDTGTMEATVPEKTPPPPNDELANFARWLQQAESPSQERPASPDAESVIASSDTPVGAEPMEPAVVAPQSTRTPPPQVDVESHLLDQVSAIQFKSVPLHRALRILTKLSTIPMTLDTDALARLNLQADVEVEALQQNVTVRALLEEILSPLGLGYREENGQLMIVTRTEAAGEQITVSHRVADLCENDPSRVDYLAKWVTQLIEYGQWERQLSDADEEDNLTGEVASDDASFDAAMRPGRCDVDGMDIAVTHSDSVQFKVLALTERLRIARGIKPSKRIVKDRVSLVPRHKLFEKWDDPVTVRVWRERSMDEIATILEEQLDIQILIDWSALYEAGWSPQDGIRLFAESLPLQEVLRLWLDDNGLAYRAIDSQTLEVTTVAAMLADPEIEFYSLRELGIDAGEATRVSEYVANQIGRMRFQPDGNAAIAYDAISQNLIIAASQPEQIRIGELLREWAGGGQ